MNATEMYGGTGGKSFSFAPGLNKNVYVKDWALEDSEAGVSLKINFTQSVDGVPKDQWSVITQTLYFPKGQITEGRLKVFIGSLGAFVEQFVSKDQAMERYKAAIQKSNITSFDLENDANRNNQLKSIVRAWFDLIQPQFGRAGTLVCGYTAPKEKDGELKQYLTVARYGQDNWWKCPFRTGADETLPPERVEFANPADAKYNYWSFSKATVKQNSAPAASNNTVPENW